MDDAHIALEAYRRTYPPASVAIFGEVTCLRIPGAPDSPMLNRIVGLGSSGPPSEETLDKAIAFMGGVTFYVSLEPGAVTDDLVRLLQARGLEPGWGWMRFARDTSAAPDIATVLDVRRIGAGDTPAFSRIQRTAYGLPAEVDPVIRAVTTTPGWTCWIAFDGAVPAAAGALFVEGETAYFGFGATLPEFRGKGGQGSIFAARIEHARALGCTRLITETGERRDDLPSNSYRNILRFGFEEQDVLQNWVRTRPG